MIAMSYLTLAGFTVWTTFPGYRWFEVEKDGEIGAVLMQSVTCWHYFSKEFPATSSGRSASSCLSGGLGDAIETPREESTYRRLLLDAPASLRRFVGVSAAISQVS